MKIALLTYSTKPRGSVVHTLELAEALTALGHTVCIYALDKTGDGFDRALSATVRRVMAQPAPSAIDALIHQRIAEFIAGLSADLAAGQRFDVYHAQDCIGANALLALRAAGKIPAVVRTVHHVEDYASPYLQHCQDRSIREPDLCLCVSDRWQTALKTDYGITAPRVLNGVNRQRFSPQPSGQEAALKAAYGLTGSPLHLTVGGIEPRKNTIRLLRAFARVRSAQPQAQLVIAGGATLFDYQPYREEFFATAQQLGMEVGRAVILPGVIPEADLPALYRCADGFCFPSVKEGWGLVVLEAIAAGLPVLVSDQPPFTEFLTPAQAVLVSPEDEAAIAAGLIELVHPQRSRDRVAQSQAMLDRYDWLASARLHLQAYGGLLGQG